MTIGKSNFTLAENLYKSKCPVLLKSINDNSKSLFFSSTIPETSDRYIITPTVMTYFVYKDFDSFEAALSKTYSEFFARELEGNLKTQKKSLSKFERIKYAVLEDNKMIPHQKGLVAEHPIDRNSARHRFKELARKFTDKDISTKSNKNFIFAIKKIYFMIILAMNEIRIFSTLSGKGSERYKGISAVRNDGKVYSCFYKEVLQPTESFIDECYDFIEDLKYYLYDDDLILAKTLHFIESTKIRPAIKELVGEL
jgi:hypothetical protein